MLDIINEGFNVFAKSALHVFYEEGNALGAHNVIVIGEKLNVKITLFTKKFHS